MNNQTLQAYVEKISERDFGKAFKHHAYFNKRLRTTGGRYLLQTHDIEVNYKHYEMYGQGELEAIIKHELCHYHLHIEGRGYQHKDQDFKALSAKVGAPRFCRSVKTITEQQRYHYKCMKCGQSYYRVRRVNTKRMCCGVCKGRLALQA